MAHGVYVVNLPRCALEFGKLARGFGKNCCRELRSLV